MKSSQVAAFRLARHHLTRDKPVDVVSVCQDVCGVQSQVMASAEMALWARMRHVTREEIRSALWETRTLVKMSCMRQTLHLIPSTDFSIYVTALRRSRMGALMRIMSKFGVTPKDVVAMNEVIVNVLQAGPMSQKKLAEHIRPEVAKSVQAWMAKVSNAVRPAILEGHVCYGPERGQEVTLVRVDQWLPKQKKVSEDEAKQILLRRYLRAYGPATLRDFARWSGIPVAEAAPVWDSQRDELVEVLIGDTKAFLLREDYKHLKNSELKKVILRLLPGFDPYLLAHAEKDHLVEKAFYKRVYRNQWWISPVVLLNGRVAGVWFCARRGKAISLEVEPFGKFSRPIRAAIDEEAASLGNFLRALHEIKFAQ